MIVASRGDEPLSAVTLVPRVVRVIQCLLVLMVLAFAATVVPGVRQVPGFDPVLDGWLQGSAYVVAAVLAALRPWASPVDRWAWGLVAAAVGCRAFAFVAFLSVVRWLDPIPYPSVADAGWLATAVLLAAAVVVLMRSRFRNASVSLVLDGVVGALAAAAIGLALMSDTLRVLASAGAPPSAVLVNLAYPALDVALLVLVLGLLAGARWQSSRPQGLLLLGVTGFAVLDTIFVGQQAAGTFRPGTYLSVLSLVATAVIAWAPWVRAGSPVTVRREWLPTLVLPAGFSLICVGLLVYATQRPVPDVSVVLASAGTTIAVVRAALSFRTVRALAQARHDARTDELTGVANRRGFNEAMDRRLRDRGETEHLALMLVDLDNFKGINDALGHQQGDEVLAMVALRLQLALRPADLLARIGGDEFAVVSVNSNDGEAAQVAERLQAVLRQPFSIAEPELLVSASIGIAVYPGDGQDVSELLQHADLAMYAAKANRAGYVHFRPEVHRAGLERVERVARLRSAIADGEMTVVYQPQVSLTSGAVVGVEALVRWRHPERGLLPPSQFLRHVESGGLMPHLTQVVLGQALDQCAAWWAAGTPVTVAVNVTVSDLLDTEFPDRVASELKRAGVAGEALVLELTEDLFLADQVRGERVMSALVSLGVAVVVDDYGTGYSSLGYLRDLRQISGLKIDRSFVTDICNDARTAAIVESTMTLAAALGLNVVAEGIETGAVRDRLAELGCTVAQGFLFSAPVPAAQIDLGTIAAAVARPSTSGIGIAGGDY